MNRLTRYLMTWLCQQNIDYAGVRIVIEFPNKESLHRAQMAIKSEIEPMMFGRAEFGPIETLNGIGLALSLAKR